MYNNNMNNDNNHDEKELERIDNENYRKELKSTIEGLLTPEQIKDAEEMAVLNRKYNKFMKYVSTKINDIRYFYDRHKMGCVFATYVIFAMFLTTGAFQLNAWHLQQVGEDNASAAVEQSNLVQSIADLSANIITATTDEATAKIAEATKVSNKYLYTTDYLNVRTSAEVNDSNRVMTLAPAKKILVEDKLINDEWYKAIDIEEGKEYYINKNWVVEESNTEAIEQAKQKLEIAKQKTQTVTANNSNLNVSRGSSLNYKQVFSMEATAYSGHSNTATGRRPVYDPNGLSTIAVDPRVIPLGSKVYVEGYGYAIAADTGGAIKGNIIDVFLNSSSECIKWGRKYNIPVYVIAYPGEW